MRSQSDTPIRNEITSVACFDVADFIFDLFDEISGISRDFSTPLGMTNKHASRVVIGTSPINISADEHDVSEEPKRENEERDGLFPADAGQDPAPRAGRTAA